MNICTEQPELPLGFGMALMKNSDALKSYTAYSPEKKRAVIDKTRGISSKADMEAYVGTLSIQD